MSRERVLHPQRGAAQAALLIAAAIGLCVVLGTVWLQSEPPAERYSEPSVEYGRQLIRDTARNMGRLKTQPCDIPALPWTAPHVTSTPAPGPARCRCYRLPSVILDFPAATAGRDLRPHQWLHDAQYERQGTDRESVQMRSGNVYQTAQ